MTGKERASPIFRPWAQQQEPGAEPRIAHPEPLYLVPFPPAFPSQLSPWEVAPHAAAHHAPLLLQQELASRWKQAKKQRPKRFQCPHCKVSFSNNGQLKGHVRIHTGTATVHARTRLTTGGGHQTAT